MTGAHPSVFLSYTTADRDRVIPFYEHLHAQGISAWMDYKFIKPGQNWNFEIRRALANASIIMIFVSNNSVNKRGYVQRELRQALDSLKEKLIDDIYILPVLLDDDVEVPNELTSVQYTRASSDQCFAEITGAIKSQLEKIGSHSGSTEGASPVRWSLMTYKDSGDGLPGYELEFAIPLLQSDDYARLSEITDVIRGDCLKAAMAYRATKFEPNVSQFNYGQAKWARINTFSATCREPIIRGKCISIICVHDFYYARAAHPNMAYKTYSFVLDPLFMIANLPQIFDDADAAFPIIRDETRRQLATEKADDPNGENYSLDQETVESGTEEWDDFSQFVFRDECVEILFSTYQVASYAHGPQSARVPYEIFAHLISDGYLYALELDRYVWDKRRNIEPV